MLKTLKLLGSAMVLAVACASAGAQPAYPAAPVRLVVSYAAGNITDTLARILAQRLSERWGQPVIVENRPGQGGSLGAQQVAKAAADGQTLLFSAMAALAINPHVYASVGYDPIKDFVPIVGVAYPNGLVYVAADNPAATLDDLVRSSRSKPGTLNYGSPGSGTVPHLNMELLKRRTGLDATHVPYKSSNAVLTDVIGGSLQVAQDSLGVTAAQIKAGKIKPLAVLTPSRMAALPDVPAITETLPGFEPATPWLGILAPAGTPPAIVDRVAAAVADALREPATIQKIQGAGMELLDAGPAAFGKTIARDHERLGPLVRELGLKVD